MATVAFRLKLTQNILTQHPNEVSRPLDLGPSQHMMDDLPYQLKSSAN